MYVPEYVRFLTLRHTFDFKLLFYKLNYNTDLMEKLLRCWSSLPCTELSDLGVAVIVDSDQLLCGCHPRQSGVGRRNQETQTGK